MHEQGTRKLQVSGKKNKTEEQNSWEAKKNRTTEQKLFMEAQHHTLLFSSLFFTLLPLPLE
jgi:hypothetical protein